MLNLMCFWKWSHRVNISILVFWWILRRKGFVLGCSIKVFLCVKCRRWSQLKSRTKYGRSCCQFPQPLNEFMIKWLAGFWAEDQFVLLYIICVSCPLRLNADARLRSDEIVLSTCMSLEFQLEEWLADAVLRWSGVKSKFIHCFSGSDVIVTLYLIWCLSCRHITTVLSSFFIIK